MPTQARLRTVTMNCRIPLLGLEVCKAATQEPKLSSARTRDLTTYSRWPESQLGESKTGIPSLHTAGVPPEECTAVVTRSERSLPPSRNKKGERAILANSSSVCFPNSPALREPFWSRLRTLRRIIRGNVRKDLRLFHSK